MNISEIIKNITSKYIEIEYKSYLKKNKLLTIEKKNIDKIVTNFYEKNIGSFKNSIENELKKKNISPEEIEKNLDDFFKNKKLNIEKIIDEINLIQKKNLFLIEIPIINNRLNFKLNLIDDYLIIDQHDKNIPNTDDTNNRDKIKNIYTSIRKYKFLHSVNDKLLQDYKEIEKIDTIGKEIENKETATLGVYFLR
jgi:hypothetical protein